MSSRLPTDEALEKEDRIDEMTRKKKPIRPAPAASTAGPCPSVFQSSRTSWHWKLPSTIARPNHPLNSEAKQISQQWSRPTKWSRPYAYGRAVWVHTHTVRNVSEIRIKNSQPCHQIVNAFEASPMIQVRLEYIVKSANVKSLNRANGHI